MYESIACKIIGYETFSKILKIFPKFLRKSFKL